MTAAVIAMTDEDYVPCYCPDRILGGQVHDLLRTELADGSILWLIPRCQEAAAEPRRLPRMDVRAEAPLRARTCDACASLRRRDRITRCPLVWRR
ncbi:hypothetical protein ACFWIW_10595 [Amycolatopsis sp. NPDC058340]|uniref:hypothetical protein n=1 Tax=Amycolatopsis sp. NPDC058340 TaxID=3346453 RepID=UPI00365AE0E6